MMNKVFHLLRIQAALVALSASLLADSNWTQWGTLANSVSVGIEDYADQHGGRLPDDIDNLFGPSPKALLEYQLRGPVSSKVLYFREGLPILTSADDLLIAVIAFPIEDDRRPGLGRHIVFRRKDGRIRPRWESEEVIQATARKAGVVLPPAEVFHEMPLLVYDSRYAQSLIAEALKKNVPLDEAVRVVNAHVESVSRREVKMARSWAELAASVAPVVPRSMTPAPTTPAASSWNSSPSAKITQGSAQGVNGRSRNWPSIVGATALVALMVVAFKLRASRRNKS